MKKLILLFTLLLTFTANAKQCVVEVSPLLENYYNKYESLWRSLKIEFKKKMDERKL